MSDISVAVNVFVTRDNQLLLGKRKNVFGAGTWGLPGGHVEPGEKLVDGAKRELQEETGIKDVPLTLTAIVDDHERENPYIHINFILENYQGEVQLMEPEKCEEWKFFELEQLPEELFKPHQKIIETFRKKVPYLY